MSEQAYEEEEVSNPYNARKPWHKQERKQTPSAAESLYYEEDNDNEPQQQKATRKKAPSSEDEPSTNYKKRYDDLKKHYDQKLSEFKRTEQELRDQAREVEPQYQAPKSQEDLDRFRTEYPDLYDTVETVAHMRSQQEVEALRSRFSVIEEREAQIAAREAESALQERHPDFDQIRGDDSFHEWAQEQPNQIQDWIYNNPNDVTLAVKALDLYKLETGKGQGSRKRRSGNRQPQGGSAADMVSTKTTNVDAKEAKIWTESEIAKMSLDQFDRHEEEIKIAMEEGRVRRG
tara:strand:+ start:917 stop:1783 length:867 start_codon:yes stop_codon:yes gene_type:complete